MKNLKHSRKSNMNRHKKQKGMAMLDQLTNIGIVVGGIVLVVLIGTEVTAAGQEGRLMTQVSTIKTAAVKWKGNAGNFTGISMTELCKDNYIGEDLCGASNGKNTNAYGGDFTVEPNSNPGLLDISVSMPSDSGSVNKVARTLANMTRNKCTSVSGCATIAVTGTTIKSTF